MILLMLSNIFMVASSFTLYTVSDLPTPSFLIDMDMLHKASAADTGALPLPSPSSEKGPSPEIIYPSLSLPKYGTTLTPHPHPHPHLQSSNDDRNDEYSQTSSMTSYDVSTFRGQSALGYIHASVSVAQSSSHAGTETTPSQEGTFLAEIDLPHGLGINSQLVMGINNHHVGSYYWARSVGMGASMEVPGVVFRQSRTDGERSRSRTRIDGPLTTEEDIMNTNGNGMLCWEGSGPLDCNSNDGKRSEWMNFVRVGDLVQLLPECLEGSLMDFIGGGDDGDFQDEKAGNVYGFSSRGRPLGSEPVVVCQWKMSAC